MQRMTMQRRMTFLLIPSLMLAAATAHAAEWGDLTATFVYDGSAPPQLKANVNKDVAFCGKFNVLDESLVVNPKSKGIANILSFLYVSRGGDKPAVHPDYAKSANAEVKLDNSKCRFEPSFTILRTTQTLIVGNSDTVGHNTNVTTLSDGNLSQNILVPPGSQVKMNFPVEERFPLHVACNIHPWMKAKVVIKEHPYVGVTDTDGKVTIKNIPVGTWTFQFWHERPGYVTEVSQNGKKSSWKRGRIELTIKPGLNDLGEFKVNPSVFKER